MVDEAQRLNAQMSRQSLTRSAGPNIVLITAVSGLQRSGVGCFELLKNWPFAQWTEHIPIVENIWASTKYAFERDRKQANVMKLKRDTAWKKKCEGWMREEWGQWLSNLKRIVPLLLFSYSIFLSFFFVLSCNGIDVYTWAAECVYTAGNLAVWLTELCWGSSGYYDKSI